MPIRLDVHGRYTELAPMLAREADEAAVLVELTAGAAAEPGGGTADHHGCRVPVSGVPWRRGTAGSRCRTGRVPAAADRSVARRWRSWSSAERGAEAGRRAAAVRRRAGRWCCSAPVAGRRASAQRTARSGSGGRSGGRQSRACRRRGRSVEVGWVLTDGSAAIVRAMSWLRAAVTLNVAAAPETRVCNWSVGESSAWTACAAEWTSAGRS